MSKDPAFLLYHQDFFTGVSDMTNEEIGAYILCLCVQASKGGISEKHMINICKTQSVHETVKSKFVFNTESNVFENKRLKEEIDKRKKYSESRSNNRKGKKKTSINKDDLSLTYDNHMENENEVENTINNNLSYKDTLLKNENWKKTISTQFKITPEEVILKLDNFCNHLETELKFHPSMNEFAKHFKNWIPVNKTKNGNNQPTFAKNR